MPDHQSPRKGGEEGRKHGPLAPSSPSSSGAHGGVHSVSPIIQGAIPRLGTGLRSYSLATTTNSLSSGSDVWRYVDDEAPQTDRQKKEREAEIYSSSGYGVATYLIGICAMDRKARSKPMTALVNRLDLEGDLRTIVFPEKLILEKNVANWPVVDVLIAWYSGEKFPLNKIEEYVALRNPLCLNDVAGQRLLLDRVLMYKTLRENNIPTAFHIVADRSVPDWDEKKDFQEEPDAITVRGVRLEKPFVEKPRSGEDHNVWVYFPRSSGGGCKKLFRKIGNRSSSYHPEVNAVRRDGSYIYEEFIYTHGNQDVKAYAVGTEYVHAETRKSPVVDGIVERNEHGKEVRHVLDPDMAITRLGSMIVTAFKQTVVGFDLLRSPSGEMKVADVNIMSMVKSSKNYARDCASELHHIITQQLQPTAGLRTPNRALRASTGVRDGPRRVLRGVFALFRHADRTPKQKIKFHVRIPEIMAFVPESGEEIAFKSDRDEAELIRLRKTIERITRSKGHLFVSRVQHFVDSQHERDDLASEAPPQTPPHTPPRAKDSHRMTAEDPYTLSKLAEVAKVLGRKEYESIKVQLRPIARPVSGGDAGSGIAATDGNTSSSTASSSSSTTASATTTSSSSSSSAAAASSVSSPNRKAPSTPTKRGSSTNPGAPSEPRRFDELELICKWGGAITHGGRHQSCDLGHAFMNLILRATESADRETTVTDTKLYTNSERRVRFTATMFGTGLIGARKHLVRKEYLVENKRTIEWLGISKAAKELQMEAKAGIEAVMTTDAVLQTACPERIEKVPMFKYLAPRLGNPVNHLKDVVKHVDKLRAWIRQKRKSYVDDYVMCGSETILMMQERWDKIRKDLYDTKEGRFNISKVPDVYDSIKGDLLHSKDFFGPFATELIPLYSTAQLLADCVVPQEYGLDLDMKNKIARKIINPLANQIASEIEACVREIDSPAAAAQPPRSPDSTGGHYSGHSNSSHSNSNSSGNSNSNSNSSGSKQHHKVNQSGAQVPKQNQGNAHNHKRLSDQKLHTGQHQQQNQTAPGPSSSSETLIDAMRRASIGSVADTPASPGNNGSIGSSSEDDCTRAPKLRFYFSSESHLNAMLNIILHGLQGTAPPRPVFSELNYLSHIVIMAWSSADGKVSFDIACSLGTSRSVESLMNVDNSHSLPVEPLLQIASGLTAEQVNRVLRERPEPAQPAPQQEGK